MVHKFLKFREPQYVRKKLLYPWEISQRSTRQNGRPYLSKRGWKMEDGILVRRMKGITMPTHRQCCSFEPGSQGQHLQASRCRQVSVESGHLQHLSLFTITVTRIEE
ncbi:hypothetical protein J6590_085979 [Homalodisca vitripennis]|nr:hypothetical protein J6590_085979 [Homalodisca vitripennis]